MSASVICQADEPFASLQMLVHQLERGVPGLALGRHLQPLRSVRLSWPTQSIQKRSVAMLGS